MAVETSVTFQNDIMPIFKQHRGPMLWRFDLTNYDHVKSNAALIYSFLTTVNGPMPPPPFDPLPQSQVALFKTWMDQGCKP